MTPAQLKDHPAFGSYAAVARACAVSRQAATNWKEIPPTRCLALELHAQAKGYRLTRFQMRSDVFGRGVEVEKKGGS